MKTPIGNMRRGSLCLILLAVIPACVLAGGPDADYFLKVNKGIDVFGRVYKEVIANYVDDLNPERFIYRGLEAMLESLDPYTIYIDKEDGEEVDLLTSGKYGGIGVTIGQREGSIQVITVMDGYSAQRQGVVPGDRILEVDGIPVTGKAPDEIRGLTRGTPGTEVKLVIEREGEPAPLNFVLIREEIRLKNVTYSGLVAPGIGYVRLERFSRRAGEEVREAVRGMMINGALEGLVIDLRGNPGGLLDAAVEVVSKFVPKSTLVVSTRGRRPDADKEYRSSEEPLLADIPLVLLTDRGSASASEIVAGSLQDVDRALVVGERTFGKGLVQTILPLNYGAQLKVTTARYYIPSGRSIQEIDYEQRDKNGVFLPYPDSLRKEFRTSGGRVVYEHGGITPDSVVVLTDEGPMIEALRQKSMFFRFVTKYAGMHREALPEKATPEVFADFRKFLEEQQFTFQEESEVKVADLRKLADELHYGEELIAGLGKLEKDLALEKQRAFERYHDHIIHWLNIELSARLHGEQGRIRESLRYDPQLETAVAILKDGKVLHRKLRG
jgi:carboxyl-terminal processing protease